jgi:heme exporter protein B
MAAGTRAREVLLPVLMFPLVVPLVAPVVDATRLAMQGAAISDLAELMALICAYDVAYLVAGFLAFSHVLEGQ